MVEQALKGEEAQKWILEEGHTHWWIYNHFRKIRLIAKGRYAPLWHLVYAPNEPQGFVGENWDHSTDQCDVVFNPNHVQEIELSTSRHTNEMIPEAGECDAFVRIILPIFMVELEHVYHKRSFGRIGYSENLQVWHGLVVKPNS